MPCIFRATIAGCSELHDASCTVYTVAVPSIQLEEHVEEQCSE